MTLERIIIGIVIIIGILMIIAGIVGYFYLGLILPFAIFLVLGGIAVVVITIILAFIII
ncbi:MAG: hypothetical protein ACTSQD_04850 [Promethearchaeota archaeon]|jgi:hypothetical protein